MKIERGTALEWRRLYEAGATVEQIALDVGTYPGKVRRALVSVDTPMRPARVRPNTAKNSPEYTVDGIKGARQPPVHRAHVGNPPRPGYRRRGRKL